MDFESKGCGFESRQRCTAFMAEWSKATDSSSVLFGGVGSNPTESKRTAPLVQWLEYAVANGVARVRFPDGASIFE